MPQAARPPIIRRAHPTTLKTSTGNLRPTPKAKPKIDENENDGQRVTSVLRKLVDRFRFDEAKPADERPSLDADLWWLRPTTTSSHHHRELPPKTDLPEYVGTNPLRSMIRQSLTRAKLTNVDENSSDHASDIGPVSSTGVGSSPSPTLSSTTTTTTTTSTLIGHFQPMIEEKPARPIFTRINAVDDREGDILYRWRLQRRLEQAKTSEPRKTLPPRKVSIESNSSSPIRKSPREEPKTLLRSTRDAATQTLQDASVQTSPISLIPNGDDRRKQVKISLSVPSRSRHEECHFRPITDVDQSTDERRFRPSNTFQSSHDTFLTDVTSVTNHRTISDATEKLHQDHYERETYEERNESLDNEVDEILQMLIDQRDRLLALHRDIEQQLRRIGDE